MTVGIEEEHAIADTRPSRPMLKPRIAAIDVLGRLVQSGQTNARAVKVEQDRLGLLVITLVGSTFSCAFVMSCQTLISVSARILCVAFVKFHIVLTTLVRGQFCIASSVS